MSLDHRPFGELCGADIRALLENDVRESSRIEYKSQLPGDTPDSKKKFLATVSSFANSGGGFLLFGVEEHNGAPVAFPGIGDDDVDAHVLRLENLVRDGLDPRLASIDFRAIPVDKASMVLVAAIVESPRLPHMVKYGGTSRFYSRHSAGKYQMDAAEIRAAFVRSEVLMDRITRFRADRLERWNDGGLIRGPSPTVILDLIPESFLHADKHIDLRQISDERLRGLASGWMLPVDAFHNVDGAVLVNDHRTPGAAVQVFRDGTVEAVGRELYFTSKPSTGDSESDCWMFVKELEEAMTSTVSQVLEFQEEVGAGFPVWLGLSMIGVYGVRVADHPTGRGRIDRGRLVFPVISFREKNSPVSELLSPLVNQVWNAFGFPGTPTDDQRSAD